MNKISLARDRWLPLLLVLLTAMVAGTTIVTVWPPAG